MTNKFLLLSDLLSISSRNNKKISIVASLTIAMVMIDFIIADFFDLTRSQLTSALGIALFATIAVILYTFCQYFLIGFARAVSSELKIANVFNNLVSVTRIIQYVLLTVMMIIVFQMALDSNYHLSLLIFATTIGTLPGAAFYALLGYRLFSWYKANRKNFIVLFLGLAAGTGAVAMSGNIVMMAIIISEKPTIVVPQTEVNFDRISSSDTLNVLFFTLVRLTAIVSTMFQWAGIALILRHFSKKIGRLRYWTIVCLPAVALLIGVSPTLLGPTSTDVTLSNEDRLPFSIMAAIGASSIIFVWGVGYLSVARSIRKIDKNSAIANYMAISAYGIILTGFAFTAPIIYVTYPPFGLAAHSYLTLAAYLFSLGFYSSAITISQDVRIRQTIRKFALDEAKLVDSIGRANMEQELQKKVLVIANKMTDETGIKSSLSDDDIRQYMDEVLNEVKERR